MNLRRWAIVVMLASGCLYIGSPSDRPSTTVLESAPLATTTPMLPGFVLRVAARDLPLHTENAALVLALSLEADSVSVPIDRARIVFLDELVRSLRDPRSEGAPDGQAAALRVVRASANAAPELRALVESLHRALSPAEREMLVHRVAVRAPGWGRSWGAPSADGWVASLAGPVVDGQALEDEVTATARRWTDGLLAEVRAVNASGDAAARAALLTRLRGGE